jgi:hypothetical protein
MRFVTWFVFLLAIGAQARAQDITLDGMLRSASLFSSIGEACSKVDVKRARDYRNAFFEAATQKFGENPAKQALSSELKRRQQEVSAVGAGSWCQKQRNYLEGVGVKDVFEN